jgi:DNA repair protein RadC
MSIYKQYDLPLEVPADECDDRPVESKTASMPTFGVREQGIVDQAFVILAARHKRGDTLTEPDLTKRFLQLKLAEKHNEIFGCIFLDNRHRVIAVEDIFFGTIDGASVHPRVIVEKALSHHAAAVIAYHNHPSGIAEPSQADMRITTRIKETLALVDVRLLDHIVVSIEATTSMAERGML